MKSVVSLPTSLLVSAAAGGDWYKKYVRYIGLFHCAAMLFLGLLLIMLASVRDYSGDVVAVSYFSGIWCLVLSPVSFVIEAPITRWAWIVSFVNFFCDFRARMVLYTVLSVPCFLSVLTIFTGVYSVVLAVAYVVLYVRGERSVDKWGLFDGPYDASICCEKHSKEELEAAKKEADAEEEKQQKQKQKDQAHAADATTVVR
eukprot:gnl/Spiro4/3455_TR1691_c0_g1_i1.p1 gnl/Spiro4/3455_TR1691_c0_g1~~gnl/Spiro4/3455_TR1691_c0_g1_i1.p1  ORF type:complete len:201 (+),score=57.97 gnl/Spiro4/3455_TR1691_c0_g1_i1:109-711(+)